MNKFDLSHILCKMYRDPNTYTPYYDVAGLVTMNHKLVFKCGFVGCVEWAICPENDLVSWKEEESSFNVKILNVWQSIDAEKELEKLILFYCLSALKG